jgi:hypothetical protein
MAHKSFSYRGYDIYLAAKQPSKAARGGTMRTMQVCWPTIDGGRMVKKQIRYDTTDVYAFSKASEKAKKWIDLQHDILND